MSLSRKKVEIGVVKAELLPSGISLEAVHLYHIFRPGPAEGSVRAWLSSLVGSALSRGGTPALLPWPCMGDGRPSLSYPRGGARA